MWQHTGDSKGNYHRKSLSWLTSYLSANVVQVVAVVEYLSGAFFVCRNQITAFTDWSQIYMQLGGAHGRIQQTGINFIQSSAATASVSEKRGRQCNIRPAKIIVKCVTFESPHQSHDYSDSFAADKKLYRFHLTSRWRRFGILSPATGFIVYGGLWHKLLHHLMFLMYFMLIVLTSIICTCIRQSSCPNEKMAL
ncbi:MAG: hypothetical protein V2A70_06550 [Candidatus Omnitrophota bacterium]